MGGRQPAKYLINFDGIFRDMSNTLPDAALPSLVSSISVADFNNDGLLDAYISTYSPIESYEITKTATPFWVQHFLTDEQAQEF